MNQLKKFSLPFFIVGTSMLTGCGGSEQLDDLAREVDEIISTPAPSAPAQPDQTPVSDTPTQPDGQPVSAVPAQPGLPLPNTPAQPTLPPPNTPTQPDLPPPNTPNRPDVPPVSGTPDQPAPPVVQPALEVPKAFLSPYKQIESDGVEESLVFPAWAKNIDNKFMAMDITSRLPMQEEKALSNLATVALDFIGEGVALSSREIESYFHDLGGEEFILLDSFLWVDTSGTDEETDNALVIISRKQIEALENGSGDFRIAFSQPADVDGDDYVHLCYGEASMVGCENTVADLPTDAEENAIYSRIAFEVTVPYEIKEVLDYANAEKGDVQYNTTGLWVIPHAAQDPIWVPLLSDDSDNASVKFSYDEVDDKTRVTFDSLSPVYIGTSDLYVPGEPINWIGNLILKVEIDGHDQTFSLPFDSYNPSLDYPQWFVDSPVDKSVGPSQLDNVSFTHLSPRIAVASGNAEVQFPIWVKNEGLDFMSVDIIPTRASDGAQLAFLQTQEFERGQSDIVIASQDLDPFKASTQTEDFIVLDSFIYDDESQSLDASTVISRQQVTASEGSAGHFDPVFTFPKDLNADDEIYICGSANLAEDCDLRLQVDAAGEDRLFSRVAFSFTLPFQIEGIRMPQEEVTEDFVFSSGFWAVGYDAALTPIYVSDRHLTSTYDESSGVTTIAFDSLAPVYLGANFENGQIIHWLGNIRVDIKDGDESRVISIPIDSFNPNIDAPQWKYFK